jgi:thiamine biosynthesis protein ThiS
VAPTDTIRVDVDGFPEDLPRGLTLEALLARRGDPPSSTIVEHNGSYVRADRLAEVALVDGDRVEIILPAFGG